MKTEPNEPIRFVKPPFTPGSYYGLTKREYFAAMAMQGLMSNGGNMNTYEEDAETAVRVSDFLIAALNKEASK